MRIFSIALTSAFVLSPALPSQARSLKALAPAGCPAAAPAACVDSNDQAYLTDACQELRLTYAAAQQACSQAAVSVPQRPGSRAAESPARTMCNSRVTYMLCQRQAAQEPVLLGE